MLQIFEKSIAPLYRQLANILEEHIIKNNLQPGAKLPSLDTLAQQFQVARVTVREAVALLEESGILQRRQGRGTFVKKNPAMNKWVSIQTNWGSWRQMVDPLVHKPLEYEKDKQPPPENAEYGTLLDSYYYFTRCNIGQKRPYAYVKYYISSSIAQLAPEEFRRTSVIDSLRKYAKDLNPIRQVLTVGAAGLESAQMLDIPIGTPVVYLKRTCTNMPGDLLYIGDLVLVGDIIKMDMQMLP